MLFTLKLMRVLADLFHLKCPQDQSSVSDILLNLVTVSNGFVHVADDKIVRSYDEDGTVLDYVRLSDDQLEEVLRQYPDSFREHLYAIWDGINSLEVDEEQIWNPPPHLLPPDLTGDPDSGICELRAREVLKVQYLCRHLKCDNNAYCRANYCHSCIRFDGATGVCENW
ncbi:hypothetical protein AJ78_00218 [Emergomyces pasteurianus Ep9510]|uniref:Uncharacterized protein n=1 Tax=Emergomyces pasteurianus Ep9510 TaxID=1447872 RepID=A0A1J9PVD9_9EURO|nr:hypothetical protein AJ78_00218 [Emergomyces pasteurianus Ep9510]